MAVFEVISTAFVVLSISALILGSIPEFQVPQKSEDGQLVYATATYPTYPNGGGQTIESRTVVRDVADNSDSLANFALTIRKSKKQMQMVGIVMMTVVIFFSTLIYFLERDEPGTKFTSIPATFWWCVVTMATVGYGDLVPVTVAGKLVGSGAIVCGVMVLALPITIMVNNFMQVVKLREEQIVKKYAQQHGDQV
ncbi:hypothetical protein B9Z55_015223 [Caenorhabditis nigoni]|nr:hypothetical protein B9Z55_015223 [Caenorhabditis nigoni]